MPGCSRRVPLAELEPRRVALIKPSALGDIIHSLPVLAALRRRYPRAHLSWVVNRAYEPLLRGHPDLDEVIPFDRNALRTGMVPGVLVFTRFLRHLRKRRFDLVIDLQGLLRTAVMALATGANRRLGLTSAREGATVFYTDRIQDGGRFQRHAVDRYWAVAQELGAGAGPKTFQVPVGETHREWAARVLRDYPRPWLAVGVGARWLTKRWPPDHFAALVRKAQGHFGGTAIFVGAPDEADLARQTAGQLDGPVRDFVGKTTLGELAALLARADVMLANDTGPLHLAAALGRPVVAPYTCTRAAMTGPYGQEAHTVETAVWCRGSLRKKCDRLECMAELGPDRLWPILREILRSWQCQSRPA